MNEIKTDAIALILEGDTGLNVGRGDSPDLAEFKKARVSDISHVRRIDVF